MVFQCINIRQVPRDLANINAWKAMFDPYNIVLKHIIQEDVAIKWDIATQKR